MAERKVKGSIILELIIAVLIVVLIATIYIPKSIWNSENAMKNECRERMNDIITAETHYKMRTNAYNDTLKVVFDYLSQDSIIQLKFDSLFANPFDSLYTDPQTGLNYIVKVRTDSTPFLQVICPNEFSETPYMYFYTKTISNHGLIKDGDKSWE